MDLLGRQHHKNVGNQTFMVIEKDIIKKKWVSFCQVTSPKASLWTQLGFSSWPKRLNLPVRSHGTGGGSSSGTAGGLRQDWGRRLRRRSALPPLPPTTPRPVFIEHKTKQLTAISLSVLRMILCWQFYRMKNFTEWGNWGTEGMILPKSLSLTKPLQFRHCPSYAHITQLTFE